MLFFIPVVQPGLTLICKHFIASISGSGNVLKVQQLLHICSEHYEAKEKEKEDDKEKKDKKDKDKKESDMGSHQVKICTSCCISVPLPHWLWLDLSYPELSFQGVAVLGIALIAMGEEIGSEMALRTFGHLVSLPSKSVFFIFSCDFCCSKPNMLIIVSTFCLSLCCSHLLPFILNLFQEDEFTTCFLSHQLRYGEPTLRRAVPLALALISVSNPRLNILDTLSKFSHDADPEVSHNSIFAMGMVGSGKPG